MYMKIGFLAKSWYNRVYKSVASRMEKHFVLGGK